MSTVNTDEPKDANKDNVTTSTTKVDALQKTMSSIADHLKSQKDSDKTIAELKAENDKMRSDMADILENKEKERINAAERKIGIDEKVESGIYNSKSVLDRSEYRVKGFTFNDLLVAPHLEANNDVKSLQKRASDIYILGAIIAGKSGQSINTVIPHLKTYRSFMEDTEGLRKAMSIGSGDSGFEWIPITLSGDLIDLFHLELKIAALFPSFTFPKGTSWKFPGTVSDTKAYRGQAAASDTPTKFKASTRATREVVFTARKLVARSLFDVELEEDAIIPVLPNLKKNIAEALVRAEEDTIINGDKNGLAGTAMDNTDMHGDAISNDSPTLNWNGLRWHINNNTNTVRTDCNGGASYFCNVDAQRNLGKYGIQFRNLAWITSTNGYYDFFKRLVQTRTIDLYGSKATILKNELATFENVPIVISEQSRIDLNTNTGVSGGASSAYVDTAAQLVWRPGFGIARKRSITVESQKIPGTDTVQVWSTARMDFQAFYTTGQTIASEIVNGA